jgi:predicted O-methyltransferase YrrM
VLREAVKRALAGAGRTAPGKHAIHAALRRDSAVETFAGVRSWPETIRGFEDLDFLFTSSQLDHGIASLQFDEAALLYRLVRDLGPATIVELGRFKGGSTMVIAAAMAPGSELWSYDVHLPVLAEIGGPELDAQLVAALERYGLDANVRVIVGDSRTAEAPPEPCGLVFVDGDHSYEGARADYERWSKLLAPGGHLLFHDAVDTGGYGNVFAGAVRLVAEIERAGDHRLERLPGAGSIAHFRKTRN